MLKDPTIYSSQIRKGNNNSKKELQKQEHYYLTEGRSRHHLQNNQLKTSTSHPVIENSNINYEGHVTVSKKNKIMVAKMLTKKRKSSKKMQIAQQI